MKLNNLINDKRLSKNNINILGLSDNSKEIKKNYIFFFKNTKNSDANHILEAINKGAKVIIYKDTKYLNTKKFHNQCIFYKVEDIEKSMSSISKKFYNIKKNSIKIYGVTGTNGKSSVVSYISQLLQNNNEKCAIIGTLGSGVPPKIRNISLTTPNIINICKSIFEFQKKNITNLAMEISSHGLSQKRIYGLDFNTVIFTNLTKEHLDYHKSMKNYFNTKLSLFSDYNNKKKIISIDSYYGKKIFNIYKKNNCITTISLKDKAADFYASDIIHYKDGLKFNINSKYGTKEISIKLYGEFTIENILLAIASLVNNKKEYNLYTKKICELMPLEGRLNKYTRKKFPIVFVDFAHTPDAIKKILLSIKKHFPDKKIITLFGCGGDRSYEKRELMGKIAGQYSEKIFIANDNPRSEDPKKIAEQIVKGINKNSNFKVILDRRKAIIECVSSKNKDRIVLILGKGHEKKQIIKGNIKDFSDKQEVLRAFKL